MTKRCSYRLILVSGMAAIGFLPTPSVAQVMTMEQRDAYFFSCVHEYVSRGMGNEDAAVAYCYPKAYGNDSGGWQPPPPDRYELPK